MSCAKWVPPSIFSALLVLLQPENAEALRISMDYGCRLGDVLGMRTEDLRKPVWSYKEEKTGKRRRVRLSRTHKDMLFSFAGKVYVFEHRLDPHRHRTRQAVYKDIKRLARALGFPDISPHSARKVFAVTALERCHDITKVQEALNHSDKAVTALYALADTMSKSRGMRSRVS